MAGKSELGAFLPLQDVDGIFVARTSLLRCTAVKLRDGSVCLFSPVQGLGDVARASLAAIGPVSYLLAPNHYHNKAMAEYAVAFPQTRLCAPLEAIARLEKQTGLSFDNLDAVARLLPNAVSLISPEGLKTGEVWMRCDANRRRTWFVVDAFCGPKMTAKNDRSDTASFLGTFPTYGVRDKAQYLGWLKQQLRADHPTQLVPCHGAIVVASDLSTQLLTIAEQNL